MKKLITDCATGQTTAVDLTPEEEAAFLAEQAAATPRALLPKSVIQERVNDINKLDDVLALLNAPGNGIYYARWFAPDWPNVYVDDAGMLGMLTMVGCTPEQIATITAPV